ncbi:MAG: sugar ABC transporter ATP-binding protein, partial [Kiritimatiellaeota bacterium]|nr:sugar ABC transporter ATP-binding protein [Kiritimatiellota bacterium]
MLHATNITKDFPGGRVLDHVSFSLAEGETLGIIGENGAGKSTLVKILSGIYAATEGSLAIDGVPLHCGSRGLSLRGTKQSPSIAEAQHAGIALVPQEFNLIPELAVFENVFLGRELKTTFGFLDKKTMRERTRAALRRLDSTLSPDALVRTLSVAQRQMTELAKALTRQCRVLILDEPTTVLSAHETECLFGQVRQLNAQGVSAILISHRLHDIQSLCRRVLVLRDGQHIGTHPVAEMDVGKLIQMMVGRKLEHNQRQSVCTDEVVLEVKRLSEKGVLHDISFSLKKGEILGVAGLAGAGRTELARAIFGADKHSGGEILKDGTPLRINRPSDAMKNSVGLVPE